MSGFPNEKQIHNKVNSVIVYIIELKKWSHHWEWQHGDYINHVSNQSLVFPVYHSKQPFCCWISTNVEIFWRLWDPGKVEIDFKK